jgi:hypothetical protein
MATFYYTPTITWFENPGTDPNPGGSLPEPDGTWALVVGIAALSALARLRRARA